MHFHTIDHNKSPLTISGNRKSSRGRSQWLPKFFRPFIYRAHRAVIFARLSCYSWECCSKKNANIDRKVSLHVDYSHSLRHYHDFGTSGTKKFRGYIEAWCSNAQYTLNWTETYQVTTCSSSCTSTKCYEETSAINTVPFLTFAILGCWNVTFRVRCSVLSMIDWLLLTDEDIYSDGLMVRCLSMSL